MKPSEYVNNGKHLPSFMSDFHDQKDLFKAIYEQWKDGENKVLEDLGWTDAHVFTIDYFLWWMGLHGYKLQKTKSKDVVFYDPEETIEHARRIRRGDSYDDLKKSML
ncbi:hypothetical protein Phi10:1_gp050 [Cellulophaga phage phi10:1]|uniref:Uncharacterized protein n=1 Tax=Cellulophaga phage phi10:1 TaxID=1327981 RepID=R9ZZ52_9CAUD|nr:hypothetical protein Phi10:1_gp050 [Cellulophaga phage phi10:1]AGO48391.1 hypothetical protein Phi10:1_gp050 [Cellulophaga phage phi10:1]